MEDAVTNVAEGIKEIVDGVSPSEESEEDAEVFDITMYLAYYQVIHNHLDQMQGYWMNNNDQSLAAHSADNAIITITAIFEAQ